MVTHMWGQPAQIIEITKICKSKNIILLEDCSHSHGALVNGEAIGTFGVAAAWSIQGQKIISGGEGGILVTNDKEIYSQALIYSHYNKRCQQELSKDCSLYKYSITGSGFKLRSHPLAVAIANEQLALAPSFIKIKRQFATLLIEELKSIPFLEMPSIQQNVKPSWYAFIMKFKRNNKFTRENFYQALKEAGLNEIDIPQSTKLLNGEALFNEPHHVLPHLYGEPIEENIKSYQKKYDLLNSFEFASAQEFYETALKLPVWAYKDEEKIVQHYIKTIKNVAKTFLDLY
jgi:dTDP-4-amino-4,6-dideoxygalactose transaminase